MPAAEDPVAEDRHYINTRGHLMTSHLCSYHLKTSLCYVYELYSSASLPSGLPTPFDLLVFSKGLPSKQCALSCGKWRCSETWWGGSLKCGRGQIPYPSPSPALGCLPTDCPPHSPARTVCTCWASGQRLC